MNFIPNLISAFKQRTQPRISLDLWLDLLESEYSDQEIEAFFGGSINTRQLISQLPLRIRQQIGLLETRLNSKVALWWALREHHEKTATRTQLLKIMAYPIFLLFIAFFTILFLNHVLLVRLGAFSQFGTTSPSSSFWFTLLKGIEISYIVTIVLLIGGVLIPKDIRHRWIVRRYSHPLLSRYRTMNTNRFLVRFSMGINQAMPLDDLLFAISSTHDFMISSLSKRVFENLQLGKSLSDAMLCIDPTLNAVFKLNDSERTVESNLDRYLKLLSLKSNHQLQQTKWILMSLAYMSFGIIILAAYQMMFEPIRLMEELL